MTLDPSTDAADLPPAPPDAPRELTPLVRRRAWHEKRVRGWWLLGVAMFLIASYYAVSRYHRWSVERRLVTTGERVEAQVKGWEPGVDPPKTARHLIQADAKVDVVYTFRGQSYRPHGALVGRKEPIFTNSPITLIVDPANPARWTARLEPAPLFQELLPAIILLPFVVIPFLVAVARRRGVLRTYRDGQALPATVVGIGHSAAAPRARLVRCALHTDDGEARVIRTVLPARKTPPVGQPLWLIAPPNHPQQAVPAALFE